MSAAVSRWRRLARFVALLLVLMVAVLVWLFSSQAGLRIALDLAVAQIPGVTIGHVHGRLFGPLELRDVTWQGPGLTADIERLELVWRPSALLRGQLVVERLRGSEVVVLDAAEASANPADSSEPFALPQALNAPLDVRLDEVSLQSLVYQQAGTRTAVREVRMQTRWHENRLMLNEFVVRSELADLDLAAEVQLSDDYEFSLAGNFVARAQGYADVAGSLKAQGPLSAPKVSAQLPAPYSTTLEAQLENLLNAPMLSAQLALQSSALIDVSAELPNLRLNGQVTAKGLLTDLQIAGRLDSSGASADAQLDLLARYRDDIDGARVELEQLSLRPDQQSTPLVAAGLVELSEGFSAVINVSGTDIDPSLYFDELSGRLNLKLKALIDQPEAGEFSIRMPTAAMDGVLLDQSITLRSVLAYSQEAFLAESVQLRWGANSAQLTGSVGRDAKLSWRLDMQDLALLERVIGSPIAGRIEGAGTVSGSTDRPIVEGKVTGLDLVVAQNSIARMQTAFTFGTQLDDLLELDLSAMGLEVGGQSFASLGLLAQGNNRSHSVATQLKGNQLEVALVAEAGARADERWDFLISALELKHAPAGPSLSTEAHGAWHHWRLDGAATGQISTALVEVADLCVDHVRPRADGRVCIGVTQRDRTLLAQGSLQHIELEYFNALLPPELHLVGRLDGEFDWRGGLLNSTFNLASNDLVISNSSAPEQPVLSFAPGELTLIGDERSATLSLGLPLNSAETDKPTSKELASFDNGVATSQQGITGSVRWTLPAALKPAPNADGGEPTGVSEFTDLPMVGEISVALLDFSWLSELHPQAPDVDGRLNGRLQLSGSLAGPVVEGGARFSARQIDVAELGINLEDLQLDLSSNQTALSATGMLRSGSGSLEMTGSLDWADEMRGEMTLVGQEFLLSDTASALIRVSPNLTASYRNQALGLGGSIKLPTAEIRLRSVPTDAVTVSADQQIVGEAAVSDDLPLSVNADLLLELGEAVSFSGLGLQSTLAGSMRIKEQPGTQTTATGEIEIVTGSYTAYGQDLQVENGKVLFAGGPVTEPGLSIRATRQATPDVLVGVNVAGSLRRPDLQVFSEPSLPQSDQLSYLILGRPITSNSSSENTLLQQAAMAIGVKGGELLTSRLSNKVGLDTIDIESEPGESNAQAALVIGKYLSPKLYVSYGYGLFNPISTLSMEYQFSRLWRIVTRSTNEATGGDVQWVLEK